MLLEADAATAAVCGGTVGAVWFMMETPHHRAKIPTKSIASALLLRRALLI